MSKVLVVGSMNMGLVVTTDRIPLVWVKRLSAMHSSRSLEARGPRPRPTRQRSWKCYRTSNVFQHLEK